jgi:hypothetical protein
MRRHVEWTLALCLLAGAPLAAQTSKADFENDQVMIREKHGQPHDHKLNRVMVYVTDGGEILHYAGGKDEVLNWKAGQVKWSPASGMHTSEGTAKGPVMLVDIGIKTAGSPAKVVGGPLDALRVDPKHFKLELENNQVRVLRLKLGPHESAPMHENGLNHAAVLLTEANLRETLANGEAELVQHKPADYFWSGPSTKKLENLSDKPFEAIIIEVKK